MGDIILKHLPGVVYPADMPMKVLGWVLHLLNKADAFDVSLWKLQAINSKE